MEIDATTLELVDQFERLTLPDLTHEDHVRVTWCSLVQAPLVTVLRELPLKLQRYATSKGQPEYYHQTITFAFICLINERQALNPKTTWDDFASENADLLQRSFLEAYYPEQVLDSDAARSEFLFPAPSLSPRTVVRGASGEPAGENPIEWLQDSLRSQFGAAIDALESAIQACPDSAWIAGERWRQPWYLAYHAIFWLDLHLSEHADGYRPPTPFSLGELEPDVFPEQPHAKPQLVAWLQDCRRSMLSRLRTLRSAADARRVCVLHRGELGALELLLYNLRHVQHHAAQLNLLIRQAGSEPSRWVMRGGEAR